MAVTKAVSQDKSLTGSHRLDTGKSRGARLGGTGYVEGHVERDGSGHSTYLVTLLPTVIEVNKRDIVFLVDGSSKLGLTNFNAIRDFIAKVIQRLEIRQDLIQVAVAQYADTVRPEFYFNTYPSKREVINAVRKMKPLDGSALHTGSALDFVRNNLFTEAAGYRAAEGVPKLLVLVTGGKSLDAVSQPAQELKRSGILAFAVGNKVADQAELEEIAFDSSLVFTATEFRPAPLQGVLPGLLGPLRTLTGTTEGTRRGSQTRDLGETHT